MITRTCSLLATLLGGAVVAVGCSGSSSGLLSNTGDAGAPSNNDNGRDASGQDATSDAGNPGNPLAGAHALGTITLGEAHAPNGGSSTPLVYATFIPDASGDTGCASSVSGCTFIAPASCGTGSTACSAKQVCTYDAQCNAACTDACTAQCPAGQECYFPSPGQPGCRQIESFDAGALAFAGTTTPITLFPPYSYQATTSGSPFLAGASIEVQASGATGAGFDKFDEKLTATTFLQTSPPLNQTALTTVFDGSTVPISWAPGQDTVNITVSGAGGSATCVASDGSGHYDLPHAVIQAAIGNGGPSYVSISVSRVHQDVYKNLTTHGTLLTATVQPTAWLALSTSSTETATFQGCTSATQTLCNDGCKSTQTDSQNCGTCGNVCPTGQYCETGACACPSASETACPDGCFALSSSPTHCGSCNNVCGSGVACVNGSCNGGGNPVDAGSAVDAGDGCDACVTQANSGTCASQNQACTNDSTCVSLTNCLQACAATDTTCLDNCSTEYSAGETDYDNWATCICSTACTTACATECG